LLGFPELFLDTLWAPSEGHKIVAE